MEGKKRRRSSGGFETDPTSHVSAAALQKKYFTLQANVDGSESWCCILCAPKRQAGSPDAGFYKKQAKTSSNLRRHVKSTHLEVLRRDFPAQKRQVQFIFNILVFLRPSSWFFVPMPLRAAPPCPSCPVPGPIPSLCYYYYFRYLSYRIIIILISE